MRVSLDKSTHTYIDDRGCKLPSVSEVLESNGLTDFSRVDPEVLLRAQQFGTVFHETSYLLERGKLKSFDENLAGHIRQLNDWRELTKPNWELMEHSLGSSWGFAGTLDRFGMFSGNKDCIVDYKTGTPQKSHPIQTAAYAILVEENCKLKVKKRFTLYITEKSFWMKEHTDKNDKNVFLWMLNIHNWKKKEGILK